MFNMVEFIKTNLIDGYKNNSFTRQQVNIFAFNYLDKGMIKQGDFEIILEAIEPKKEDEDIPD